VTRRKTFLLFIPLGLAIGGFILYVSVSNYVAGRPGCPCTDVANATGEFDPSEKQAYFLDHSVLPPLAMYPEEIGILGEQAGEDKWIEVDLSEQKLRAWQGSQLFLETLVSTGKWAKTPTGEYRIWTKFKYAKMSGGSKEKHTYYYLPNVPYTMYFYNGYGLHGTYWHNNFGHPMSHGCVNLPTPMAEKLFYWVGPVLASNQTSVRATADNPGTRVVIHD